MIMYGGPCPAYDLHRLGLGLGLRLCVGLGLTGRPGKGRVYLYSGHGGRARGTRKPAVKPSDGEPTRGCCAERRAPVPLHLDISCQCVRRNPRRNYPCIWRVLTTWM